MPLVFDALGTLFDLSSLDGPLADVGGTATTRRAWFERLLGSARALTMAGQFTPFGQLATSTLAVTLAQEGLDVGAAEIISAKIAEVPAYSDARAALECAAAAGLTAVVLTNGGRGQTEDLIASAGLTDVIRQVFSVEEVRAYKPDARPYLLVADRLEIAPDGLTLIAAHGWDVLGARSAGLRAVWVDRLEHRWSFPDAGPELRAPDLVRAVDVAAAL